MEHTLGVGLPRRVGRISGQRATRQTAMPSLPRDPERSLPPSQDQREGTQVWPGTP